MVFFITMTKPVLDVKTMLLTSLQQLSVGEGRTKVEM